MDIATDVRTSPRKLNLVALYIAEDGWVRHFQFRRDADRNVNVQLFRDSGQLSAIRRKYDQPTKLYVVRVVMSA
jgi:hypothetical protein